MSNKAISPDEVRKRPDYGALELIPVIEQNTWKAEAVTLFVIALLMVLYWGIGAVNASKPKLKRAPVSKLKLSKLPPPPTSDAPPPPPPAQQVIKKVASGPAARAGTPVPVPDALITPDMKEFADVDDIARASSEGGDGEDFGGMGDGDGEAIEFIEPVVEEEPDMFDFFEGEEPVFDIGELQRLVKYPELAKRAGIEGKVVIMALVGTDGTVERDTVIQSDSDMLNQAALDALYKLSESGQISPGISSDGEPARVWVTIPVSFRLR